MNNDDLKCKVCGKLASEDTHFYPKQLLCNRHYLQLHLHGKFLDNKLVKNDKRKQWTEEEINYVREQYAINTPIKEIAETLNVSTTSITSLAGRIGITNLIIKPNNPNYKAPYQDYDWCFERFINRNMSQQEMANELGVSKRVIQKWCGEIHHINANTYKELKHLNEMQKKIAIVGTIGDGHISKQDNSYIESHAIDEKDYLFWKYSYFKDICNHEPTYYPSKETSFGTDKQYKCQPFYRFNTRGLNDFETIRNMSNIDKINMMDEFMFCIHILDDGSRDHLWNICLADWNKDEQDAYIKKCEEFGLICRQDKDERYFHFTAFSSAKIDEMLINNIPNELDIMKKKIFNNTKIQQCSHFKYVIVNGESIGLSTYFKNKPIQYQTAKQYYEDNEIEYMNIDELEKILEAS